MAGDWIKMKINLDTDPAVVRISSGLNTDTFSVVGRLHKIWSWANEHLDDGQDVPISSVFLDKLVEFSGFTEQMRLVGWLSGRDGSLSFPSFERHNGASAKSRALDALRKQEERKMSDKCPDANRTKTGPEKRREEKSIKNKEIKHEELPKLKEFTDLWMKTFKEVFNVPYIFVGGRDGMGANNLIKLDGYNAQTLMEIAKKAWSKSDSKKAWYCVNQSRTIHGFSNGFNQIRSEVGDLKANQDQRFGTNNGGF